jgi:beta-lactamase regulating signal transducer with metallopeptidase domain
MESVLNWLVQGAIVGIAAAVGLRFIPSSRTQARHGFIWAAYGLVAVLPVVPRLLGATMDVPTVDLAPIAGGPVVTVPAAWWTTPEIAIALWFVWAAVHAVRFGAGALTLREARRQCSECPGDVLARLAHWPHICAAGRPTRVVVSNRVRAAAVLGCGSPVIALAPGLVECLSAADLDRVLVHEWAHIQRRDDLAQLAQRLLRVLVGWHPAAWWLERQLELEREVACDELAVRVTGSAKGYAVCLATVAALPRPSVRSLPALAAASSSGLRRRLERILAAPGGATTRSRRAVAVCGAAGFVAVGLAVGNVRFVASATSWAARAAAEWPVSMVAASTAASASSRETTPPDASSIQDPRRRPPSAGRAKPAGPAPEHSARDDGEPRHIEALAAAAVPSVPLTSMTWTPGITHVAPVAPETHEMPVISSSTARTDAPPPAAEKTPWAVASDAGVAVGRASQRAGVATAGFFSRFGKAVARSF